MAEDINKKISIKVEAETGELTQSVTELNKTLDTLLQKQKQLSDAGLQNTKVFADMTTQIKRLQSAVSGHNKAVDDSTKALNTSKSALQQNKENLDLLKKQYDALVAAQGDNAKGTKELNTQIGLLTNTITEQEKKIGDSRKAFDIHKGTTDALKVSFDKLKNVSGDFGPSLKEAADGFDALKSGLSVVKTGFTSVGAAIKTTGFGLLVLVLQSVVDYFTKTTEGSAKLKGGISALGKVIEVIHKVFSNLGDVIVNAFMHPVESIEALGKLIWDNIVNRFKAFGVILDGIIHRDFKKMADGVIQSFTGVTHATDKIVTGFKAVKNTTESTLKDISKAYDDGYKNAGKHIERHEAKIKGSLERIKKYQQDSANNINGKNTEEQNLDNSSLEARSAGVPAASTDSLTKEPANGFNLDSIQKNANQTNEIKKSALQKFEEYAKQSEEKITSTAFRILSNSIKQQSEAKIVALEKDKTLELNNKNLTSAQRLAIEQKYKKQEGQVKAKAFKEEQEASIAQAVINGALAITKAESQTGVLGTLVIPGIIAETAAQIAKIATQKPPAYAKGGLHYSSDGRGGVLPGYSRTDNTNAYLRSGEGIVVSEAMRAPWARNLVSAINVGFGGRDFSITNPGRGYAVGGIFTDGGDANRYYNQPVTDQKNLANTIAYQMINNFPPVYVDVKDVNNQQNILAQTINRVNL